MPITLLPTLVMALASEFISNDTVLKWIGFGGEIVTKAFEVDERLKALTEHIETMVAEEREPTEEEWKDLQARSDIAHDAIQSWKLPA